MTIERARIVAETKPWGVIDLRPWNCADYGGASIGELRYGRSDDSTSSTSLMFKLLLTRAPLSIQVHPDDAYARAIGLSNGKTEAWYILSAAAGAQVAIGLKFPVTQDQLRTAIADGSIAQLVAWRPVQAGDVVSVPAGTIHAIGAGIVLAEIQQNSDATFRLFDHGRDREINAAGALAVAHPVPAVPQQPKKRLTDERILLVANIHFVFEHITLGSDSAWRLDAACETWLLILDGRANIGSYELTKGEAVMALAERLEIHTGLAGVEFLVAYAGKGRPVPELLRPIPGQNKNEIQPAKAVVPLPARIGTHP